MEAEPEAEEPSIINVVPNGNVILKIKHTFAGVHRVACLRCDSQTLSTSSKYFATLFRSGRFAEGNRVIKEHSVLLQRYGSVDAIPLDELPRLQIEDVGHISTIKSLNPLLNDFFTIISGHDIPSSVPVANLANLAVVADRFDAVDAVAAYVKRKKLCQAVDGKLTVKQDAALTEERLRQRILVGLLLDNAAWVEKYSARLIIEGSRADQGDAAFEETPLWWDLPNRLEDEIEFRRKCVLWTIQDLQRYFLKAYSSRERQCRLGYGNSPQCDSFQFGEMVRFFLRSGTLHLQGVLQFDDLRQCDDLRDVTYRGSIIDLIERLKQIPEYQIDTHHTHCGIRTRVIPLLDLINHALRQLGVCGDCWRQSWTKHAWIEVKRPMYWKRLQHGSQAVTSEHERRHDTIRSLFLAQERDWEI